MYVTYVCLYVCVHPLPGSCFANVWSRPQDWQAVEFFAGKANLSFCLQNFFQRTLTLDRDMGGRFNDLLTPAGMAWAGCEWGEFESLAFHETNILFVLGDT